MGKISLQKQLYQRIQSMNRVGESRHAAKQAGTAYSGIYSWTTYHNMLKVTRLFIKFVTDNHPECTSLRHTKAYVFEYMQLQESRGLRVTTLVGIRNYINKLLGISPSDSLFYPLPPRRRADITKSRFPAARDSRFSNAINAPLIELCQSTGLRRCEVEKLRSDDLRSMTDIETAIEALSAIPHKTSVEWIELRALHDARYFNDFDHFLRVRGKGGKIRYCPIIGDNRNSVVSLIQNVPSGKKVFEHVISTDIHSYRAEYAAAIYQFYARPIAEIPTAVGADGRYTYQPDVYTMRRERAGEMFDRAAMLMASRALGHNRVNVVADHYLYGIEGERKQAKLSENNNLAKLSSELS